MPEADRFTHEPACTFHARAPNGRHAFVFALPQRGPLSWPGPLRYSIPKEPISRVRVRRRSMARFRDLQILVVWDIDLRKSGQLSFEPGRVERMVEAFRHVALTTVVVARLTRGLVTNVRRPDVSPYNSTLQDHQFSSSNHLSRQDA